MKHPFVPGQLVVCVNRSPLRTGAGESQLKLRAIYRVETARFAPDGKPGVTLVGVDHRPHMGFHAWRFRPIEPAGDAFVAHLRGKRERERA